MMGYLHTYAVVLFVYLWLELRLLHTGTMDNVHVFVGKDMGVPGITCFNQGCLSLTMSLFIGIR
jgi:hypothetical protein